MPDFVGWSKKERNLLCFPQEQLYSQSLSHPTTLRCPLCNNPHKRILFLNTSPQLAYAFNNCSPLLPLFSCNFKYILHTAEVSVQGHWSTTMRCPGWCWSLPHQRSLTRLESICQKWFMYCSSCLKVEGQTKNFSMIWLSIASLFLHWLKIYENSNLLFLWIKELRLWTLILSQFLLLGFR